jgi:UDP-N-acetylmuramoyl-tripeptide--D-alanyl-D-alanine ligase
MSALWSLADLVAATGGRVAGAPGAAIAGLSIDSRTVGPGEAFFAIRGDRLDGHDFVADALDRGAAIAVVAGERLGDLPPDGRYVVVPDVLAALVDLARAARARSAAKIVAVTGSVGKTGTKEMLRLALGASGPVHASVASFNNHWGVPLSLARMPAEAAFGVFEIGMSAPGEIAPLARLVRPHAAIVTTVVAVHAAFFASEEEIADAKAEIFLGLAPGGTAIVNADNRHADRLAAAARAAGAGHVVTFGEAASASVRLIAADLGAEGSSVDAEIGGRRLAYRLGAPGRHLVMNSLAVLAATNAIGADLTAAAAALAGFGAPAGRGARTVLAVPGGTATLIDEAYNANPTSMRAAFAVLALAPVGPGGRRIAVLGDMLELGPEGPALHAGLADALMAANVDRVHCAGPLMKSLHDALPARLRGAYADAAAGIESVILSDVAVGDVVMVKGSNGSRMGRIVTQLKGRYAVPAAGGSGD